MSASSYRLQFVDGQGGWHSFKFKDAIKRLDYLEALGIQRIYASPLMQAQPGAGHGYAKINDDAISKELGGEEDLLLLAEELARRKMGMVLDIVPNHMHTSYENLMWRDLLENGENSEFANFFDLDWDAHEQPETKRPQILLPVLGDHIGKVFERNYQLDADPEDGLKLHEEPNGKITLNHWGHKLPIDPSQVNRIKAKAKGDVAGYWNEPAQKEQLWDIITKQNYRLAWWRAGFGEQGKRRFFDVNSLVGIRQERREVFERTHVELGQLIKKGVVQAIRVDHPDGLKDPELYFKWLGDLIDANKPEGAPPIEVIGEKIYEHTIRGRERMPATWRSDGTSGYDFLKDAMDVFVNPAAEKKLAEDYQDFTGERRSYEETLHDNKKKILNDDFDSELTTLSSRLLRLAKQSPDTFDYTDHALRPAIRSIITHFDVYRTYNKIQHGSSADADFTKEDMAVLQHAIKGAKDDAEKNQVDPGAIDFIYSALTGGLPHNAYEPALVDEIIGRVQHLCAPVMAKGKEDTTGFEFNRLTALNEVGCDPGNLKGMDAEAYHAERDYDYERHPNTMTTLGTHDTKRSPDTRLPIVVALTEYFEGWQAHRDFWHASLNNAPEGQTAITKTDETYLYQTLIGTWPADMTGIDDPRLQRPVDEKTGEIKKDERGKPLKSEYADLIAKHMNKAIREAKVMTKHTKNNVAYEAAVDEFVDRILDPRRTRSAEFINGLYHFNKKIAAVAHIYSLGQLALQAAAPGNPDFYNGSELWDQRLVDPGNRGPVDFDKLERCMEALKHQPDIRPLLEQHQDGRVKQAFLQSVLNFTRDNQDLARSKPVGIYAINPEDNERFIAVLHEDNGIASLTLAPRLIVGHVETEDLQKMSLRGAFKGVTVKVPQLAGKTGIDVFSHEPFTVGADGIIDVDQLLHSTPVPVVAFGDFIDSNKIRPIRAAAFLPAPATY